MAIVQKGKHESLRWVVSGGGGPRCPGGRNWPGRSGVVSVMKGEFLRESRGAGRLSPLLLALALVACGTTAPAVPARGTSPESPVAVQNDTRGAPGASPPWAPFDAATFAKARAEHRFVVLDGAAEWCHWCHVMEAVTYHDATVRSLLDARFIAAKVDIDARPDIEERYAEYGWPATVIFSPGGEELGKYRGFIAPEAFADILRQVGEAKRDAKARASEAAITGGSANASGRSNRGTSPAPPGEKITVAGHLIRRSLFRCPVARGGFAAMNRASRPRTVRVVVGDRLITWHQWHHSAAHATKRCSGPRLGEGRGIERSPPEGSRGAPRCRSEPRRGLRGGPPRGNGRRAARHEGKGEK